MAILRRISNFFTFSPLSPDNDSAVDVKKNYYTPAEESQFSPVKPSLHGVKGPIDRASTMSKPLTAYPTPTLKPTNRHGRMDSVLKDRFSMSPTSKVHDFLFPTPVSNAAVGSKRRREDDGDGDDQVELTSPFKKTKIVIDVIDEEEEDELDGDTLLDLTGHGDDEGEDDEKEEGGSLSWHSHDEADETLLNNDYDDADIQSQLEEVEAAQTEAEPTTTLRRTLNKPADPATKLMYVSEESLLNLGWPEDTVTLIRRLHQRGHEPILPAHWTMDFPTLPDALFMPDEDYEDQAAIRSLGGQSDFRTTKALGLLFKVPSRARDKLRSKLAPEVLISQGIIDYIAWAYADAGVPVAAINHRDTLPDSDPPMPPLIMTHTAHHTLDSKSLEAAVLARLIALHQDWIDYFLSFTDNHGNPLLTDVNNQVPTVYAVVISHTHVAMVALPGGPHSSNKLRQVGHFDFGDSKLDVWNGLAVALLAVRARDIAWAVWSEYEGGNGALDVESDSDPDA
ncbi:hypothetical protein BDV97DRAFT_371644 [Delphinella strobiligena]|nr:hypothetical protein BDV97DRAFT_371644 [Delphinella strobiligena]